MIITRFKLLDLESYVYFCIHFPNASEVSLWLGEFSRGDVAASSFFMQAFLLLGFYPERDCVMVFSFF